MPVPLREGIMTGHPIPLFSHYGSQQPKIRPQLVPFSTPSTLPPPPLPPRNGGLWDGDQLNGRVRDLWYWTTLTPARARYISRPSHT